MGVHHINMLLYEKKLDNMMSFPTQNLKNVLPLFADLGVSILYVIVALVFMCLIIMCTIVKYGINIIL